jgi:hypothetical protein
VFIPLQVEDEPKKENLNATIRYLFLKLPSDKEFGFDYVIVIAFNSVDPLEIQSPFCFRYFVIIFVHERTQAGMYKTDPVQLTQNTSQYRSARQNYHCIRGVQNETTGG